MVFSFFYLAQISRDSLSSQLFSEFWLVGPLQLSFGPWVKPLVTPLIRVRGWWKKRKNHESNFFVLKWEEMWRKKTTQPTSDFSTRHQKFIWEHHIWCHVKISEVATLVSMIPNFWWQRWARIRTASNWIRTEANFGGMRTGSDCNFLKIGGSGLGRTEKIFGVLMWLFWKIFVVIRFHRFAKW